MATFRLGRCLTGAVVQQSASRPCTLGAAVSNLSKFSSLSNNTSFPTNSPASLPSQLTCVAWFHNTSPSRAGYFNTIFEDERPKKVGRANLVAPRWLKYNDIVYPPTEEGEPERPAEICHARMQIKYSTKKLWYLAVMVRGLSVDEAIKQLSFHKRKGAAHIKEVLEEAQQLAVQEHNVEYKSNLWICDSFVGRGIIVKGIRRHARGRIGTIDYRYTNYFVRLREGRPPEQYYPPERAGNEWIEYLIKKHRESRIRFGL